MEPLNKLTADGACRTVFSNDVSFASFYNAAIFEGKQIIHPDRLVRYENDISFIINDSKRAEDKKRRRDIVVKSDINGIYCILGIEHQSSIDETMVIRCGIYEMLEYLKQAENKEYKRLVPQIIVVLYTGPKKWNSPVKLSDYFEIPEELKKYFDDWKIILVDVKEMDTSKIKDEQTRYFIEAIQAMYKGSYEDLKRLKRMKKENFLYAAIITGSIDQVESVLEGDEMDMCEGMERMAEGFRSEGREEGILVGRNEGKLEEKQNTLLMQLRCKLGDLSKETENTIRSSTMEKLNKLTVSIFDIQSENDVLKLIH
ncbi:MAG: Rpn family recombination-promoting nuclease/putative transposase [Faecalibacillus intestinalis]|uniref:Rpn family recombination-promoting nuclease/putative transposase n=1 Tax=Faecalibacillus intestinalis TaxID=1982626 RepID=UPI0039A0F410